MVKKVLKWTAVVLIVAMVAAFGAFLYLVPPFFLVPPEQFGKDMSEAAPSVTGVPDPATRVIAERGRYIVMTHDCIGCHAINGPQGPDLTQYLAGGGMKVLSPTGTYVTRNLTSDRETGLARRSDDEVKRVLRSGTFPDGHVAPHTAMPWASFSNWTEEDRHAVVTYLRTLKAVKHEIPEAVLGNAVTIPGAVEVDYAFKEYGVIHK
jgi:mono/diheme cytochrome c family protein